MMCQAWKPETAEECIPLTESCGRILSRDAFAINTLSLVRASAMDGIAVKADAFAGGVMPDTSGWQNFLKALTAEEQETLLSLLEKFRNSFSAGICVVCGEKVVKKYFHDYLCYRKNVVEWIIV